MEILNPDQREAAGLDGKPIGAEIYIQDRRRIKGGPKPPASQGSRRRPVQRLPKSSDPTKGTEACETYMHIGKFPMGDERNAAEAGVALSVAEGLVAAIGIPCNLNGLHRVIEKAPYISDYMKVERQRKPGRILISPEKLSLPILRKYVEALMVSSLAPSDECALPPVSPQTMPMMLGGITLGGMDKLCQKIFSSFGYEVPKGERLSNCLCTVGLGSHLPHVFVKSTNWDISQLNQGSHEKETANWARRVQSYSDDVEQYERDKGRSEWLRAQPDGSLVEQVLHKGSFEAVLQHRVAKARVKVARDTVLSFIPDTGMIGKYTLRELMRNHAAYAVNRRVSDAMFSAAVRRVFEGSWFDLDLGGELKTMQQDVEVVMARQLISALASTGPRAYCDNLKVTSTTLLGMALGTGIPIGNIIRFAIEDINRRGDTFIKAETIKEIYGPDGLIEDLMMADEDGIVAGAYRCGEELEELYFDLLSIEEDSKAKPRLRWNRKLRMGNSPLWSHKSSNRYLLDKLVEQYDQDDKEYYLAYPDAGLIGVNAGDLLGN